MPLPGDPGLRLGNAPGDCLARRFNLFHATLHARSQDDKYRQRSNAAKSSAPAPFTS